MTTLLDYNSMKEKIETTPYTDAIGDNQFAFDLMRLNKMIEDKTLNAFQAMELFELMRSREVKTGQGIITKPLFN